MSFNHDDEQTLISSRTPAAITHCYGKKNNAPISDQMATTVHETLRRAKTLGVEPTTLFKIQGIDLALRYNIKVLGLMTRGPDLSQQLHMAPAKLSSKR